jgi:opacity protein-like surface antigen
VRSRLSLVVFFALIVLVAWPRDAAADATAFLGFTTTPTNRSARGFAVGFGLLIVGFEFEYSATTEDPPSGAPSLRAGSFNGLLQTPFEIARMQFYATAGGGVYREVLGTASETNVAVNTGGGVKITLAGPIRLRIDYRVFKLSGSPLYSHPQRLYAGLNLKF